MHFINNQKSFATQTFWSKQTKSQVYPCRNHCRDTDRQTDGFSALYNRFSNYLCELQVAACVVISMVLCTQLMISFPNGCMH